MAEKIQFFVLDAKYKINNEKAEIYLFGKTVKGEHIILIDESFEPYFYVIPKKGHILNDKLEKIKVEAKDGIAQVTRTENVKKVYFEKEVDAIKVFTKFPKDVPIIREVIKEWEMIESINEYDIQFIRRYFIDNNITPMMLLEAEVEKIIRSARVPVFLSKSIKQVGDETLVAPKIIAFDIETYNPHGKAINFEKNPIIMLSLYGKNYRKVITWKRFNAKEDYIEFVDSESDLIQKFKELVEHADPDILVGYYSDGFDLPYILKRAEKYKIKLDIGLDHSELDVSTKKETSKGKIAGIIHIDAFRVITKMFSQTLKTDFYDLSSVAEEMIGEKKLDVELDELAPIWDKEPEKLERYCAYNLHDSKLAFGLAEKIMPNLIEMVKIVGLPMFEVSRMGFSQLVEWYLIKQAYSFNEICPNKPNYGEIKDRMLKSYKGAFVFEPKAGLYKEVLIFDFRSLYPSIVSSHNISPGTLNCSCCEDKAEKAPLEKSDIWFCKKKKGFLPKMIEELIERRMRIKEIIKKGSNILLDARQNNLKVLANAFYGYYGFFNARWYCLECAQSITAWGRYYIHKVIDAAEKEGFKVIYSDSIAKERFVTVLDKDGLVRIKNIEELFSENANNKYNVGEKEFIDLKGYRALTVNLKTKKVSWENIKKIIRHKSNKKIFRVNQKYGETVVTEDHSVMCSDGNKVFASKPQDIKSNHLVKIVKVPEVKKIGFIDNYEVLKSYSYNVIYKGQAKTAKVFSDKDYVWFGLHKRKKPVKVKRIIKVGSDEFSAMLRLLGFYIAEGSSSTPETTGTRLGASISMSNIETLKNLQKDYYLLFKDAKTSIIPSQIPERTLNYRNTRGDIKTAVYKDNTYKLQMMNSLSAVFFKMFCGQKSRCKRMPYFIYHVDKKYQKILLDSLIEGDGSKSVNKRLGYSDRYIKDFFKYTTNSLELASGFSFLLTQMGQKHTINYRPSKGAYSITTTSDFNRNFKNRISEEGYDGFVYDLEVENTHVFVDACGQILLHNTDSIFLHLQKKTKAEAMNFAESINMKLPGIMELEYDGYYPAALFVSLKANDTGAKKKYALIDDEGKIHITGFETVRRNWSDIAKEVQEKVLTIILKENDSEKALKYVSSVVNDLIDKRIPVDKVIIHTQLQKDVADYASVGPHVVIAKQLKEKGFDVVPGMIIEYVVTEGKGKIGDRVKLPEEIKDNNYDPDYYINNQVIPSVERIFEVFGYTKEDFAAKKGQSKLGSFI